jgi:hypothetical protein
MAAKLRSGAPVFCVNAALKPVMDYMINRLGFAVQGTAGDPPSWASLCRDGVEVMLACGNYPAPAQDWAAYIYVEDPDDLYAEFSERGADMLGPPTDKPYGLREFDVRLPDGRRIAFGG